MTQTSQQLTMQIFLLPCLLMAVSLPVIMSVYLPGTISEGDMGDMYNMTGDMMPGDMDAYCYRLMQNPDVTPDQIPWYCLCTYCKGTQGPKGDQGDRGLPGPPGSPGRRGLTGFRGPRGFTGRPGIKGQKGDEGNKGDQGMSGLMGPKGQQGYKGEKGQAGMEGLPGNQGPKGDDGICPDACEASQGPPGPPGLPGPAGPRGNAGPQGPVGPKGSKGDMGNSGQSGIPGEKGEKGNTGPMGECDCEDGAMGAQGPKGDMGSQGPAGPQGPVGPAGPAGMKGNTGEMGLMGIPGPCMPAIQSSFSAELTQSDPPPNAPVVFSRIIYNVQGDYDPSLGVYFAPVNGTYLFTLHATVADGILKVGIFHNFYPITKQTETQGLGTTSNFIILHLYAGDAVWIQVKDLQNNKMYAGEDVSSTFSGSLLYPDSCDDIPLSRGFGNFIEYLDPDNYSWDGNSSPTSPPPSP